MRKYSLEYSSSYMESLPRKKLEKTFENAYREFTDPLFRFVYYRVSNKEEAVDIVEDVFMRLWQSMEKGEIKEMRAYIFKTARNTVIDWYRKKKAVTIRDFEEGGAANPEIFLDMFPSKIPTPDIEQEAKIVIEKIKELEPIYREVIYLRYVEELTPKEISAITGEPTNLISVRINRGMKQLKAKFDK